MKKHFGQYRDLSFYLVLLLLDGCRRNHFTPLKLIQISYQPLSVSTIYKDTIQESKSMQTYRADKWKDGLSNARVKNRTLKKHVKISKLL